MGVHEVLLCSSLILLLDFLTFFVMFFNYYPIDYSDFFLLLHTIWVELDNYTKCLNSLKKWLPFKNRPKLRKALAQILWPKSHPPHPNVGQRLKGLTLPTTCRYKPKRSNSPHSHVNQSLNFYPQTLFFLPRVDET